MNVDIDHLLIAEHHNSRTQMEQTLGLGVLCKAPARMQTFEGIMLAQPDQSSSVAKALLML